MTVPYTFANQTGPIPLAELDANFAAVPNYANTAGIVTASSQPNITSVGTLTTVTSTGLISTTGNISGNYIIGNGSQLTGVEAKNANADSIIGSTLSSNVLYSSLTSVGTLSNLSVTGNVTTAGYFIGNFQGNITGNLTVPGANTQVIYNNNGNAGASAGFTFNQASNAMTVTGNIVGNYIIGNGSQLTGVLASGGTVDWANIANINNQYGPSSVSIGQYAGAGQLGNSVAIGYDTGTNQGESSVAIGYIAGNTNQGGNAIAIGRNSGNTDQGGNAIAIGRSAGAITQGGNAIAIGRSAGNVTQSGNAIAIGRGAGNATQGESAIAIGFVAGQDNQGGNAIAIGRGAGNATQGGNAIAIGLFAGNNNQSGNAIAIGINAANVTQGIDAIAIGHSAGNNNQGYAAIAIGAFTGNNNQGANSVALGSYAGYPVTANNAIVINGLNTALNAPYSGLYIAPIMNDTGNTANALYYNTSTNEITYAPAAASLASRTQVTIITPSLAANAAANIIVSGYKGYALYSIESNAGAWVTMYTSNAAAASDYARTINTDPTPGSGVIAEAVSNVAATTNFTPGVIGFNLESPPTTAIPVKVVNNDSVTGNISVTFTLLKTEQ